MSKKTIRMFCYGPITLSPKYESPWEDVWIKYHQRRKVISEGPCVVGTIELDSQIRLEESLMKDHPSEWRDEHLKDLLRIKSEFSEGNRFALLDLTMQSGTPDIFVNQEWITRSTAEEAIAWYLRKKGVLKTNPRFRWWKNKDLIISPVSIG